MPFIKCVTPEGFVAPEGSSNSNKDEQMNLMQRKMVKHFYSFERFGEKLSFTDD